jgi:hypothetical protein
LINQAPTINEDQHFHWSPVEGIALMTGTILAPFSMVDFLEKKVYINAVKNKVSGEKPFKMYRRKK